MAGKENTQTNLLSVLQTRFEKHPHRHPHVLWEQVETRLKTDKQGLAILQRMEESGGEPDVTHYDPTLGHITFTDCSKESPSGRRSLCYDETALNSRKENKPKGSAMDMARMLGIELLDESQYLALQAIEPFDLKTSSWVKTPEDLRKAGGALFGDNRFGRSFIYHNGAESYYAARGFRGYVIIQ